MIPIPPFLRHAATTSGKDDWLRQLPDTIERLQAKWSLQLGSPLTHEATCSWVAPCTQADGSAAIFKLGLPHMEARDEAAGLRFWRGDPTVHLLDHDPDSGAMLLEPCVPGSSLSAEPPAVQDPVLAGILKRLWRTPPDPAPFRPLRALIEGQNHDLARRAATWPDPGLAHAGAALKHELDAAAPERFTLATDLHAGNVLRAQRRPWLAIDPKPFVGDPHYDATQHLVNHRERLFQRPEATISRFAEHAELSAERIRLWLFARYAAEFNGEHQQVARRLDRLSFR
ncbi:MAG: aminoglycoside phosphotransferase family protein [Myxococcota bacterium]